MDLKVQKREVVGKKVKGLRRLGLIPGELYGREFKNQHIAVSKKDFEKLFREAGKSTVINLEIDGKKVPALIYEAQKHPLSGEYLSIDFYHIRADEKIQTEIPIKFVGIAPAVKNGFLVVKVMDELTIETLPQHIPHEAVVDLTSLVNKGDTVYVKDLNLPKEVKVLVPPDTVIVNVVEKEEEEVEKVPPTPEEAVETEKEEGSKKETPTEGEKEKEEKEK